MIVVDARECAKQVKDFAEKSKLNLHKMVERFALHLAQTASNNTPIGDQDKLTDYFNGNIAADRYIRFYLRRAQAPYYIEAKAGFHRGAWVYSEGSINFDKQIYSEPEMLAKVEGSFRSSYKLGDTFYIGMEGPGGAALNRGSSKQAPLGIIKPTVDEVVQAYSANLQHFYRSN